MTTKSLCLLLTLILMVQTSAACSRDTCQTGCQRYTRIGPRYEKVGTVSKSQLNLFANAVHVRVHSDAPSNWYIDVAVVPQGSDPTAYIFKAYTELSKKREICVDETAHVETDKDVELWVKCHYPYGRACNGNWGMEVTFRPAVLHILVLLGIAAAFVGGIVFCCYFCCCRKSTPPTAGQPQPPKAAQHPFTMSHPSSVGADPFGPQAHPQPQPQPPSDSMVYSSTPGFHPIVAEEHINDQTETVVVQVEPK